METKKITALLAGLAALIGLAIARKRPVKPPAHDGSWQPHK